jgi:hypothetical protein
MTPQYIDLRARYLDLFASDRFAMTGQGDRGERAGEDRASRLFASEYWMTSNDTCII